LWSTRGNRIIEIAIIVIGGAIISFLNTLWLKHVLIKQIEIIAKNNEMNILKQSKVTNISDKMNSKI
jgi:hypothetical protein